jgi:5'-nucleotidase
MTEKPLILLSNDDGIDSPYLTELADAIDARTGGEAFVIAPERQRSAMSHTITLHKPLRVTEHGKNRFAASGSPVDCVYLGLMKLAPRRPALVVSGINDGFNLGTDVHYSGTVGAAVEGGLRGVSSIAISLAPHALESLSTAVDLGVALVSALLANPRDRAVVLNVNVPANAAGRYRWTRLGKRYYEDDVHERTDPRGKSYFWIGGGLGGVEEMSGSDCEAVGDGVASITPLVLDMTAHNLLGDGALPLILDGFENVS